MITYPAKRRIVGWTADCAVICLTLISAAMVVALVTVSQSVAN